MPPATKFTGLFGILSALVAAFFFNSGMSCVKYVYQTNENLPLSGAQILFVRGAVMTLCVGVLMIWDKVLPFEEPREIPALSLMGFIRATSILFFMIGLKTITVGTNGIVASTQSIFTSFFGMIFLKERYSITNCVLALLVLFSIVLVIAPNVIGGESYDSFSSTTNQIGHAVHLESTNMYLIGVGGCLSGVILKSLFTAYSRKFIRDDLDFKVTILYPGLGAVLISPIVMLISQSSLVLTDMSFTGWVVLVSGAFGSFLGELFTQLALKYQHAGVVSFLLTTELLWAYSYDLWVAHESPNKISIVGIILTVMFTSLFMSNRICSIERRVPCLYGCNKCKDKEDDKELL